MSAPSVDVVVDRLDRLAQHAPAGGIDPDALWSTGRRRQRGRWAVGVAGCLALVACLGAALAAPAQRLADAPIAVAPDSARRVLPAVFRTPGQWEPAFPAAPGPLVAVGRATRGGWTGDRSSLWGVSALTGESRFLDLPDQAASGDGAALSDDGTRLAYWVTDGPAGASTGDPQHFTVVTGVAVVDLVTGEERRWDAGTAHGFGAEGLVWAGDVLWFSGGPFPDADQDSFAPTVRTWGPDGSPQERRDPPRTIAGAVEAVDRFIIESGTSTTQVRMVDGSGDVTEVRLTHRGGLTSEVSSSPDGTHIAGLGHPRGASSTGRVEPLLVGEIAGGRAEMTRVAGVEAPYVLGWRSPTEVVIGVNGPDGAIDLESVDVTNGTVRELVQLGETAFGTIAAGAWAGEVIDAPEPPFAPDPRLFAAGAVALALVLVGVWRQTRIRRGRP